MGTTWTKWRAPESEKIIESNKRYYIAALVFVILSIVVGLIYHVTHPSNSEVCNGDWISFDRKGRIKH